MAQDITSEPMHDEMPVQVISTFITSCTSLLPFIWYQVTCDWFTAHVRYALTRARSITPGTIFSDWQEGDGGGSLEGPKVAREVAILR